MAKKEMYWFYNPPKAPKPKVPESIKIEVKKVGDELIESVLKPTFIEPNPKEKRFNYIVEALSKFPAKSLYPQILPQSARRTQRH